MSGAQPPPRIRMRRPLTRKSRPPLGVDSDVTSRMPYDTCCASDTRPPIRALTSRSYKAGLPSSAGHHSRGLATCSDGKLSLANSTYALSPGPSVNRLLIAFPRVCATSVPVTDWDVRFLTRSEE